MRRVRTPAIHNIPMGMITYLEPILRSTSSNFLLICPARKQKYNRSFPLPIEMRHLNSANYVFVTFSATSIIPYYLNPRPSDSCLLNKLFRATFFLKREINKKSLLRF